MKNLSITLSAIILSLGVTTVIAEPALVINTLAEEVGFLDGNGEVAITSCDALTVLTRSKRNTVASTCHAKVPNDSGRAVKYTAKVVEEIWGWEDVPCTLILPTGEVFETLQWKLHISAAGEANFQCLYKDEK